MIVGFLLWKRSVAKPQTIAEGTLTALKRVIANPTSITVPCRLSISSWIRVPTGPKAMLKGRTALTQAARFVLFGPGCGSRVWTVFRQLSCILLASRKTCPSHFCLSSASEAQVKTLTNHSEGLLNKYEYCSAHACFYIRFGGGLYFRVKSPGWRHASDTGRIIRKLDPTLLGLQKGNLKAHANLLSH